MPIYMVVLMQDVSQRLEIKCGSLFFDQKLISELNVEAYGTSSWNLFFFCLDNSFSLSNKRIPYCLFLLLKSSVLILALEDLAAPLIICSVTLLLRSGSSGREEEKIQQAGN